MFLVELKIFKSLTLIIVAYLLLWTPNQICIDLLIIAPQFVTVDFYNYSSLLAYFNSAVNPFLYAIGNSEIKDALKSLITLRGRCCKKWILAHSCKTRDKPSNHIYRKNWCIVLCKMHVPDTTLNCLVAYLRTNSVITDRCRRTLVCKNTLQQPWMTFEEMSSIRTAKRVQAQKNWRIVMIWRTVETLLALYHLKAFVLLYHNMHHF